MQLELAIWPAPPEHVNARRLAELELGTGAFYYALRELSAGRPCPVRLTVEQRSYVDRFVGV